MEHLSLAAELAVNSYPGRGIVIGRSDDGLRAVIAYFIMGRSANSRNRVFTEKDGGIITQAADPSKLEMCIRDRPTRPSAATLNCRWNRRAAADMFWP